MSAKEKEAYASGNKNSGSDACRSWLAWLRNEMKWNKKLITLKVILFFFSGGATSFLPFLTLHMQQLGITVREIAIIYAFLPIASLLGPPTSGIFADKFGKYKIVLMINMVLTTIFHCMLLYVPSRPRNSLTFSCGTDGHQLTWDLCDNCHNDRNGSNLDLVLRNCKFLCESPPENINLCYDLGTNSSTCQTFSVNEEIKINGTLFSRREADVCVHHWYDLMHEENVFQGLNCISNCPVQCQVSGKPRCHDPEDPSNDPHTFWAYFALRMVATFFLASSFTMLDATTLAVIKDHDGDFGKQRVLNMLGQALVPLVAGILVDFHSKSIGYSDYMPSLYLGAALTFISAVLVIRLNFRVDKAGEHFLSDLRKLITKPEIDMFLVMILIQGSNWGFIESYLFVYLKQLNAPNYLLGLTLTVGCIVGVPVMYIADKFVNKVGRHVVFIISFVTYAMRQFGYANIDDPWLVFPFEMLEVFTYQIMWVAAVTFCPILAPKGLLATMTGLAGAVHYSVGRGVGALLGGYLISQYGIKTAFNFFGYVCVAGGGLYVLVYYLYLKKKIITREQEMEKEECTKNGEEGQAMLEYTKKSEIVTKDEKKKKNRHLQSNP